MSYQNQQRQVVSLEQQQWLVTQAENEFNQVVSRIDSDINWEKEKAFALQCLMENDYLASVALSNPISFKAALINLATTQLTLNPILKYAYLVPRDQKVMLDVGYLGLIHQAVRLGYVQEVQAKIVYENDSYENRGFYCEPHHTYNAFGQRGQAVGCVVVAHANSGSCLVEEMTQAEIYAVRQRSKAFQAYQKNNKKLCPWVTDEYEMWRKTTVKRAFKYWITNNTFSETYLADDHQQTPNKKQITADKKIETKVIPLHSEQAQNLSIAINDCLNMNELNELANCIRDSGLGDHEISSLRRCWAKQRQYINETSIHASHDIQRCE